MHSSKVVNGALETNRAQQWYVDRILSHCCVLMVQLSSWSGLSLARWMGWACLVQLGFPNRRCFSEARCVSSRVIILSLVSYWIILNLGLFLQSKRENDRRVATLLFLKSVDIDRYCKLFVHQALQPELPSRVLTKVFVHPRAMENPFESTHISLFENVPYLRRFRIGTDVYVTSSVASVCHSYY